MLQRICKLLLIFALLWPGVSWGGITSTGVSAKSSGTGVSVNLVLAGTTAGNLVVVCAIAARGGGPQPTVTVTDGGNTWNNLGVAYSDPQGASISWSTLSTGGSRTINVSGNGSNTYEIVIFAHEFSGQHATPTSGSVATNTGTSAAMDTGTVTPADADALVVGCGGPVSSGALTENQSPGDTNWTLSNEDESAGGTMGSFVYHIQTGGPTARRAVWSNTSSIWAAIGAAFKPAVAAAGVRGLMMLGVGE
jgi:hypothetical protein